MQVSASGGLPENAYRKLNEGEVYRPIIPADDVIPEITTRSVVMGLVMAVIFSAAAATLGLKVGQVFEAAIPIAILAVGAAGLFRRRSTILENVIIQSIGAASGVVVAGAIFTIPGLFILQKEYPKIVVSFFPIFVVSLLGGVLGILFMILFRRYFVSEMHGEFPFPEATATTEVLVTGEKGGAQAKVLVHSMIIAGVYDFLCTSFELWREVFTTRALAVGNALAQSSKIVFKLNVTAAVLGLGYIVGLRYGAIICAGSFLSYFILVPLVYHFGAQLTTTMPPVQPGGPLIAAMSAEDIFRNYVRLVGIGGIACAGIIGILKSSKIIYQAFTLGFKEIFASRREAADTTVERTQKDLSMATIFIIAAVAAVFIFIFFRFRVLISMENSAQLAVIGLLVVLVISFLFTSVAARAIAIVGTNPVSGMTLMTLILSSLILIRSGLEGELGMMAALLIGGVVCTALSMAGGFITDLKIGYWIGSTPYNQERFKFLGTLVSAATVALVLMLLNETYGFVEGPGHPADKVLVAPQANAMAAVIKTFMDKTQTVPWTLYGLGVIIALVMELIGIPPLAFALGMYIPLELNTPILLGGLLAHLVSKSSRNDEVSKARNEKGTLIASGFIAGGAIISVIGAILKFVENLRGWHLNTETFLTFLNTRMNLHLPVELYKSLYSEGLAFFVFVALCILMYRYATGGEKKG
jgi:putative OPT family oligopeptide transporter